MTDACIGWPETVDVLRELAAAVRAARIAGSDPSRTPLAGWIMQVCLKN